MEETEENKNEARKDSKVRFSKASIIKIPAIEDPIPEEEGTEIIEETLEEIEEAREEVAKLSESLHEEIQQELIGGEEPEPGDEAVGEGGEEGKEGEDGEEAKEGEDGEDGKEDGEGEKSKEDDDGDKVEEVKEVEEGGEIKADEAETKPEDDSKAEGTTEGNEGNQEAAAETKENVEATEGADLAKGSGTIPETKVKDIIVDEKDRVEKQNSGVLKSSQKSSSKLRISVEGEAKLFEVGKEASEMTTDGSETKISPKVVISGFDFLTEEEIEEESSESAESIYVAINRVPFYEDYVDVLKNYGFCKRLNNFFHKRMAEYFRKRKMEHILREADHVEEALFKYNKKLETFATLIELDSKQRETKLKELEYLRTIRNTQFNEADKLFNELVDRELQIGTGLISAKTGKEIPEKYLEKLLKNQKTKAKELQELLLIHIKIRNAVAEKTDAIRTLDRVGENCTLIEYEQLKIENQGFADKMEEKEEELAKLRRTCQASIQTLAHLREKCTAFELNIENLCSKLEDKEIENTEVREELNEIKQQRDYYRRETQKLKDENGLLTSDKLLIDLEISMQKVKELEGVLVVTQELYDKQNAQLKAIGFNIEKERKRQRFARNSLIARSKISRKSSRQLYKGRPTLLFPQFEPINKIDFN